MHFTENLELLTTELVVINAEVDSVSDNSSESSQGFPIPKSESPSSDSFHFSASNSLSEHLDQDQIKKIASEVFSEQIAKHSI